ncbi:MAG: hypothetical protein ABIA97_05745 [Candidatus Omnitrophota bacterium]
MKERRKNASKGVIIFSSIIIFIGAISFLSIIISFFQLRLELQLKDDATVLFTHFPSTTINFTAFWFSTILSLVVMICWIVAGIGTLILKEWARQLLLVSIGIYFLNKVVDIFINISIIQEHSEPIPIAALVIGIVFVFSLTISITYFFTHPLVMKQFNKKYKTFR